MHWYLKIPRFDGCKTLAFNGFVLIVSCSAQIWLQTGGSPLPVSSTALWLIAAVAGCNLGLRMVTERSVWWRQCWYVGWDLAEEGSDQTVYHHAAEFVERSDFTDWRESKAVHRDAQHYGTGFMQGGKHVPLANFYQDLDGRLCDTREALNGRPELPFDADERAS